MQTSFSSHVVIWCENSDLFCIWKQTCNDHKKIAQFLHPGDTLPILVYSMHTEVVFSQMFLLFELWVTAFAAVLSVIRVNIFYMIVQAYTRLKWFVTNTTLVRLTEIRMLRIRVVLQGLLWFKWFFAGFTWKRICSMFILQYGQTVLS